MNEQSTMNLIAATLALSESIRYVALYQNGKLQSRQRHAVEAASDSESDRYEELLVNPTLLLLAKQRGEIDCGGLRSTLISYGNFRQYVRTFQEGHVSICLENMADPIEVATKVDALLATFSIDALRQAP